jgi:hypothetical protein
MSFKLSEYHTGFRAFSREVLEKLPLDANSDDFVFDNQMLRTDRAFRLPSRRDLDADALLCRGFVDQLSQEREVRLRRIGYFASLPRPPNGHRQIKALRRRYSAELPEYYQKIDRAAVGTGSERG